MFYNDVDITCYTSINGAKYIIGHPVMLTPEHLERLLAYAKEASLV